MFTPQLMLVLIAPTHGGMGRLGGWFCNLHRDGLHHTRHKTVTDAGTNRAQHSSTM